MPDILQAIIDKKKATIKEKGFSLGIKIPTQRSRSIVPFLATSGVILEIKKASPSKGDIAPNLDIVKTAKIYADSGAQAISVLTEQHYFKGSLRDLQIVADTAINTAILRKDFIIYKEEIAISYLCGADAVLLIARILDGDKLEDFALECVSFGITPFIEIRDKTCVEKFHHVSKLLQNSHIQPIAGINSRDLVDFRIDTLVPSMYRDMLGDKVVFESGISTRQAASFTKQRGFYGILVGEAAAKEPTNAKLIVQGFNSEKHNSKNAIFWEKIAHLVYKKQQPLVKICGITNVNDAICATNNGADMLGFIFCKTSERNTANAESIIKHIESNCDKKPLCIGVLTDLASKEGELALHLADMGILDALQYHGFNPPEPQELQNIAYYGAVRVKNESDINEIKKLYSLGHPRILIDSFSENSFGGNGISIDGDIIDKISTISPLWLAGGINPDNISSIICKYKPELVDLSSGVESEVGKKSHTKLNLFFERLRDTI